MAIEVKEDGIFTILDIFGKPLVRMVERGWHVLFADDQGMRHFGFVCRLDLEQRQLQVLDDIVYPDAPLPLSAIRYRELRQTETCSICSLVPASSRAVSLDIATKPELPCP
jgi:hypothetical protein